jgi:ammonium transporter, Amt family
MVYDSGVGKTNLISFHHKFMKTLTKMFLIGIAVGLLASPTGIAANTFRAGWSAATMVAPNVRTDPERIAELERKVADAKGSADNAWVLVSSALVLLMTGPGLALFYGGLVRKKNVLATMLQSFAMMSMVTIMWGLFGYSLAFGSGNSFIGGFEFSFLRGVGAEPNADYAATIPHLTFMIYQLMFAVITPALITGAFAERMKFKAMLLFMALWIVVVYSPMAHMVWGKGGLLNAALGGAFPTLDFAGGTVVHVTSGVSALVCALYMGKRIGYPHDSVPPHSVVLSFIGACLLWVGWFGFNAGSALSAGSLASSAFVATHFAAATAAAGWTLIEWKTNGRPSALGAISGAVSGLVAITPAAGFVKPMPAMLIGFVAGICCYLMVAKVKARFGYDDSLDAFGVHGAGGTIGAILTGIFAVSAVNPILKDANGKVMASGLIEGNAHQLINQLIGVGMAWALGIVGTLAILGFVDKVIGLRVSAEHETQGLDLSQHGEEGYDWESSV